MYTAGLGLLSVWAQALDKAYTAGLGQLSVWAQGLDKAYVYCWPRPTASLGPGPRQGLHTAGLGLLSAWARP